MSERSVERRGSVRRLKNRKASRQEKVGHLERLEREDGGGRSFVIPVRGWAERVRTRTKRRTRGIGLICCDG